MIFISRTSRTMKVLRYNAIIRKQKSMDIVIYLFIIFLLTICQQVNHESEHVSVFFANELKIKLIKAQL